MYIKSDVEYKTYTRKSKLGQDHEYVRKQTIAIFRCDNCSEVFTRPKSKMSPKRLSNNYFHCCPSCDPKRFAQKKGAERRTIWNMPASSMADISRL